MIPDRSEPIETIRILVIAFASPDGVKYPKTKSGNEMR
jgi:hypothetical protein